MKRLGLTLIASSLFILTGCATPSAIHLKDGSVIQSPDKPKYDDNSGFYKYKGVDGKSKLINKDEIKSIEPLN